MNLVRVSHPVVSFSEKMCLVQKVTSFNFYRRRWRITLVALSLIGHQLFFVSSGYKIRRTFPMALHSFICHERPVSIPASRFRWFQMIAQFLKRSPAQYFFSLVVFEKLSRNVSTKMSWFQCTLWYGLVQFTISNKAKVAVAVERDAFALIDFPVVILLVEFCTDPQSCFLAVWLFAIELPKLILKFHHSMKYGILLLENGSSAVWIQQI